jgi:hypothetical protein
MPNMAHPQPQDVDTEKAPNLPFRGTPIGAVCPLFHITPADAAPRIAFLSHWPNGDHMSNSDFSDSLI